MPSGLLFILLGVMWAVVLIPMWLRKHDEANETRSVDRFSRALGSLSGRRERSDSQETVIVETRGVVPAPRSVVMPGRPRGAQEMQVMVSGPPARPARVVASAATRRRRLVLALLAITALALVGGLLHRIPVWVSGVPALIAVAVLVRAHRKSVRGAEMERRRQRRGVLSAAARDAESRREQSARRAPRVPTAGAAGYDEVAAPVEDRPLGAGDVAAEHWHAVPTTLPTYVTAPAATRVPRVIDRTPGGLSGAAMVEQARRTRHEEPAGDSGMRVESFEIPMVRVPSTDEEYAARYVDTSAGAAELEATDDEAALEALLDDPRTGLFAQVRHRRAAG